ncbi:GSCOCG00000135001-RA-CDS [Cotesia congregata]|nr:GSCOCG00000135001-RA-CDS [Cotesia congregata]
MTFRNMFVKVIRYLDQFLVDSYPATSSAITSLNLVPKNGGSSVANWRSPFDVNMIFARVQALGLGTLISLPPLSFGGFQDKVTDWLVISSYSSGPSGGPGRCQMTTLGNYRIAWFRRF